MYPLTLIKFDHIEEAMAYGVLSVRNASYDPLNIRLCLYLKPCID